MRRTRPSSSSARRVVACGTSLRYWWCSVSLPFTRLSRSTDPRGMYRDLLSAVQDGRPLGGADFTRRTFLPFAFMR